MAFFCERYTDRYYWGYSKTSENVVLLKTKIRQERKQKRDKEIANKRKDISKLGGESRKHLENT